MKLVYYPDAILDAPTTTVDVDNLPFDPVELKNNMVDVMIEHNGIGLSANQVGLEYSVFVMGNKKNDSSIFINPEVLQVSEATSVDVEGCLSFPAVYVKVKRPTQIQVRYYDENLEQHETVISGYSAKCFLHEYDHLMGVTLKDRVSKLKWDMAQKKANKALKAAMK